MNLNSGLILGAVLVALECASVPVHAQERQAGALAYPVRPIRIIVGAAPGSGDDNLIRRLAPHLSQQLGNYVVVDNRAGAVGALAVELAARASADGYTLLVLNGQSITGMLLKQVSVDIPKAFVPVVQLSTQPNYLLIATPSLPANSIQELIALAKAKPGGLNYASSGTGGQVHLGMELFSSMAGIEMVHVPYKGSGQVVAEVIAGHVQLAITNILTAGPLVKSGRIKALGVTGLKRAAAFPNVPTIAESGAPGFELKNWYGLFAPVATPQAVVTRLNAVTVEIINSPDIKRELATLGVEAAPPNSPADFQMFIAGEVQKWDSFLKKARIKID